MKTRILPSLSLLLLLMAACAPAAVSTEAPVAQPIVAEPTPTAFQPSDASAPAPATDADSVPTEAVAPLPVATSRGDNLHATAPSTVSLASGGLQFVEFFRFT